MERAKSIIIFFVVLSIIIFAVTHGAAWFKNGGISSLSSLISVLKFDIPIPR
ncbi:MAG: hypothetical protein Q8L57_02245 [bacterium]|nr:hypothetical protein [bacterium]